MQLPCSENRVRREQLGAESAGRLVGRAVAGQHETGSGSGVLGRRAEGGERRRVPGDKHDHVSTGSRAGVRGRSRGGTRSEKHDSPSPIAEREAECDPTERVPLVSRVRDDHGRGSAAFPAAAEGEEPAFEHTGGELNVGQSRPGWGRSGAQALEMRQHNLAEGGIDGQRSEDLIQSVVGPLEDRRSSSGGSHGHAGKHQHAGPDARR